MNRHAPQEESLNVVPIRLRGNRYQGAVRILPVGLFVVRPVEGVDETRLGEQAARARRHSVVLPKPSARRHAKGALKPVARFGYMPPLLVLAHPARDHLGRAQPMRDKFVSARTRLLDEVRTPLRRRGVDGDADGQVKRVEQRQQPENADTVAVLPVGPGSVFRLKVAEFAAKPRVPIGARRGRQLPVFQMEKDKDREPRAARQPKWRAPFDR